MGVVRVKPMEWRKAALRQCSWGAPWLQIRIAHTLVGLYAVEKDDYGVLRVTLSDRPIAADLADIEAAQSAAQADYEARILACIEVTE
jgi:hypothetical protein